MKKIIFVIALGALITAAGVFAQDDVLFETEMAEAASDARGKASGGGVSDYFTDKKGSTAHLDPYTQFALGIAFTRLGIGLGTDFPIGALDLFGPKNTKYKDGNGYIILDFDKVASEPAIKSNGVDFNLEMYAKNLIQFELSFSNSSGVGLAFGGISARFDLNLSNEIFQMLADGIKEGEVRYGAALSGAVFIESLKAHWHTKNFFGITPKLFVGATASHYIPYLYIPRSDLNVKLTDTNYVEMGLEGTAEMYMAADVFENPASLQDWGGIDISLQGEYALFPILDLGVSLLNIPLIPAGLHTKAELRFSPERNTLLRIDDFIKQGFNVNTKSVTDVQHSESSCDTYWVVRPMRWDFYMLFRPLHKDLLVFRPNIGFTVFNPSEETYFNVGLETQLNLGRILTLSWFTGGYDGLCRNRLGFDLRMWRIARLYLGLEMRSQDYAGSWTLKGAAAELGLKFGGGFSGVTNF